MYHNDWGHVRPRACAWQQEKSLQWEARAATKSQRSQNINRLFKKCISKWWWEFHHEDTTILNVFSSVQPLSRVRLFVTPWIKACQASLSITNSQSLPKLMSIESVMPSSHLILCRPLLLLPSIPPSIRVLSSESTLPMRWPKYWSFSFSISPSNEHPGLISFRMDWLDLLCLYTTCKKLLCSKISFHYNFWIKKINFNIDPYNFMFILFFMSFSLGMTYFNSQTENPLKINFNLRCWIGKSHFVTRG